MACLWRNGWQRNHSPSTVAAAPPFFPTLFSRSRPLPGQRDFFTHQNFVNMAGTTIFSDLLRQLGVPHTGAYSDQSFRNMNFKSLFGFSRLLQSYGIPNEADRLSDKSQLAAIPTPFLAKIDGGFVIVTDISAPTAGKPGEVSYIYYHKTYTKSYDTFLKMTDGTVLRAFPTADSREPDYGKHHFLEVAAVVKKWILIACAIFLITFGVIDSGMWRHLSTILLTLFTLAGVVVAFMLIQKSAHIHNHAADKMCGLLVEHGCDTVLKQKASSFFGLFGWSEVGMAYFSITFLVLMIFPEEIHNLALINACCVPFSFWSVWYQKFRAKSWCTLCLTVQGLLWCQFFCYLLGGWWQGLLPININLFLIGAAYVATLLGLNALMPALEQRKE